MRMMAAQHEIFTLCDQVVRDLVSDVIDEMAVLQDCSESIAILDVLASLASVSTSKGYVRPEFGDHTMVRLHGVGLIDPTRPSPHTRSHGRNGPQ